MLALLISLESCGGEEAKADITSETAAAETTAEVTTKPEYTAPMITDFDGYEFRIAVNANRNVDHHVKFTEKQNGEIINDAVWARNIKISEEYNIQITGTADKDNRVHSTLKTAVLAGEDYCDVGSISIREHFPLAKEGCLIDVNTLDGIGLSQPWWDQALLENFNVSGHNYTITGDISTSDDLLMLIMIYNHKLYENYGFENPYHMVLDGKWTFDRFWEMAQVGSVDLDGDGKMTDKDQWGVISEIEAWYYFSTGSGLKPLKHTPEVGLAYTLDEQKSLDIIDKTKQLVFNDGITLFADDGKYKSPIGTVFDGVEAMFMANQGLFYTGLFNDVTRYRNMETDYGILPTPKYSEEQEKYYNLVTFHADFFVFPITLTKPERSALITDALSYESMLSLNPYFYDLFLNEKLARDEESKLMIDIILKSKTYDLDWTAQISQLGTIMSTIAKNREDTFVSSWASVKEAAEARLKAFTEAYNT